MKIFTLLLITTCLFSAEVANEPAKLNEFPADVKAKMEEIKEHRKHVQEKIEELKVILKNHPHLEKIVLRRLELADHIKANLPARLQDAGPDILEERRERVRKHMQERRQDNKECDGPKKTP